MHPWPREKLIRSTAVQVVFMAVQISTMLFFPTATWPNAWLYALGAYVLIALIKLVEVSKKRYIESLERLCDAIVLGLAPITVLPILLYYI